MADAKIPQWALMASNGRSVGDLSREELELLFLDMRAELDSRKQAAHGLREQVKRLQTRVRLAESSLQDADLGYLKPPKALRAGSALRVAKSARPEPRRAAAVAGAFNPYEAGNRRVISLQLRAADLRRQIADAEQAIADLGSEQARVRARLERGGAPCRPLFRHERPIPAHGAPRADPEHCMAALEQLIQAEQGERLALVCCHDLLTGRDRAALDIYARLLDPRADLPSIAELEGLLLDREAQASVLMGQAKFVRARQREDMEVFLGLRERLRRRVAEDASMVGALRAQISELDRRLARIAPTEAEIARLGGARASAEEGLARARREAAPAGAAGEDPEAGAMRAQLASAREAVARLEAERAKSKELRKDAKRRLRQVETDVAQAAIELQNKRAQLEDTTRHLALMDQAGVMKGKRVAGVLEHTASRRTVAMLLADAEAKQQAAGDLNLEYRELKRQCRDRIAELQKMDQALAQLRAKFVKFAFTES
jgi:predicted  nucleic acid-binding Zn-ribbon protein